MGLNRWIPSVALLAAVVLLFELPATATVVGGAVAVGAPGAKFIKLSVPLANPVGPPNSVGQDTFNLPNLYAFDEDQNIKLKSNLRTDVGKDPIPAGTVVASHYVFFDPGPAEDILGTVDFDSRVVAIITSTGNLAASDFLANTGIHYLNPDARGLEPGDSASISGTNQITFDTRASSPGDYVRVLTEFSPRAKRITSLRLEIHDEQIVMDVDRKRKTSAASLLLFFQ
ncbi:MAG TPA: hypothetical protein VFO86_04010 [Terriglobia bacterium]|nr:hypothetical protein [Terriglobia bacterium]